MEGYLVLLISSLLDFFRTSEDYLFIYLSDHGAPGIFGFPNDLVSDYSSRLNPHYSVTNSLLIES